MENDPLILKYCMIKHAGNFGNILEFHDLDTTRKFITQNSIVLERKSPICLNGMDSWWIYGVFTKKFYVVVSGDGANRAWNNDRIELFHDEPVMFGIGQTRRVEESLENMIEVLIDRKWKY